MSEEQALLTNAQNQLVQYIQQIDLAVGSSDPDEMRQYIIEALPLGQSALDNLEVAMEGVEDPEVTDRIEEVTHHMYASMEQADHVLEAVEDDALDFIIEMRKHAEQSMEQLNEAVGIY